MGRRLRGRDLLPQPIHEGEFTKWSFLSDHTLAKFRAGHYGVGYEAHPEQTAPRQTYAQKLKRATEGQ